jgi:hypothetical protein
MSKCVILSKGYGAQSAEEKQRLFKLMRNLNFNGESASEPYMPAAQTSGGAAASDGFWIFMLWMIQSFCPRYVSVKGVVSIWAGNFYFYINQLCEVYYEKIRV